MLYSFDIFDTLITRRTAEPHGVFVYMQDKLSKVNCSLPTELLDNFVMIRMQAEDFARDTNFVIENRSLLQEEKKFLPQDITLEDIYCRLAFIFDLSTEQKYYLLNLEVQCELELLYPIRSNIETLKSLITNNEKVILISDMYLPSDIIRKLLITVDEMFKDIKIYVSSETKRLKRTGDMYDFVKEKEGVEFFAWTHYGDNYYSDIEMTKQKGINAVHLYQKEKLEVEKRYLWDSASKLTAQFMVGISNLVKLKTDKKRSLLAASYMCPIMIGYIEFIIQKALSKEVKTLYFIARDGYLLKYIADKYIKHKNLNIRTKYIYGSRKAFRVTFNEDSVSLFFHNIIYDNYMFIKNLSDIADILNVDKAIMLQKVPLLKGFSSRKIKVEHLYKIVNILINNNDFLDYFKKEILSNKVELTKNYLLQEIDFSEKFFFIDFFGSGMTASSIDNIISTISSNANYWHCFLFLYRFNQNNRYLSYFIGNDQFWNLEALLRANHGQTMGYKKSDDGKIVPSLSNVEVEEVIKWGFDDYVKGIDFFMEEYLSMQDLFNLKLNFQNLINIYQSGFRYDPFIVEGMSQIPHNNSSEPKVSVNVAPKYTWKDVFIYLFNREHLNRITQNDNFSRKISNKKIIKAINFISKYL